MEPLGERPVWSMSDSELLPTIDQVDAAVTQLLTYRLQLIARVDEVGLASELGARDTAELLAIRHRIDRRDVHRDVKLSRSLPKYDAVATALTDQTRPLRPAQASVIVTALERVRSRVPVEDLDVAEEQLVNLARLLSPGELAKAARQICDLLDSDGPEPDENAAYARESLTLVEAENGVKFRGYLANENAELLRSRIHAAARPHKTADGKLDPRSREQRQADALTATLTIAAAAAESGFKPPAAETCPTDAGAANLPPIRPADDVATNAAAHDSVTPDSVTPDSAAQDGAAQDGAAQDGAAQDGAAQDGAAHRADRWVPGFGAKANITVTIDFEDLKSSLADATGEVVYGDGLSAAAIRRLACDAKVIPLVLGSNSEPLDVGRAERLVTRAMRRALNVRDKGCVVCGAPPIHCDAHHLRSWIDGGETAIHNLVLLCRAHHRALHAGYWIISIIDGQVQVSRPSWADPPPQPSSTVSALLAATAPARPDTCASAAPVKPNRRASRGAEQRSAQRSSRWSADEPKMQEATRFAVWGNPSTDPPPTPLHATVPAEDFSAVRRPAPAAVGPTAEFR
ncbi:HNH endonuclease signature motif containing protein [Kribbella pratensis]|uniref:HNH endonuclease n=1 Tax=Kribbella pratensis TaxID=2512112 RepID=A0A4R8CGL9_9ACTN|nr:HNH endonuclease signature motif containing protein [Kribbella pratensis]TDW75499.1 HNH endonuclease [Kribbella pratensis]